MYIRQSGSLCVHRCWRATDTAISVKILTLTGYWCDQNGSWRPSEGRTECQAKLSWRMLEAGRPFGSDIKLKSRREEENLEGAQDTDTARKAGGPGTASMEEREDREHSEEMGLMG